MNKSKISLMDQSQERFQASKICLNRVKENAMVSFHLKVKLRG